MNLLYSIKSNALSQAFLAIGTKRMRVKPQITRAVTLRFIESECQVFPMSKPGNEYPRLCHQLLSRTAIEQAEIKPDIDLDCVLWFFLSQNRALGVPEPGIVWPVTEPIITINILGWTGHLVCSYGRSYIGDVK